MGNRTTTRAGTSSALGDGRRPGTLLRFGIAAALLAVPVQGWAQSLTGGRSSMQEQFNKGIEYDYTPLRNAAHVMRFVELGLLVRLPGNADYTLHQVSFPYARPEVRLFVERLARQYRRACGEQLVVTSLTRPLDRQPRNSSPLSVHPRGMAVDLRRSNVRACRSWLEDVLLHLERNGTVQATRERRPPHYHIAVYTRSYAAYVAQLENREPEPDLRAAQSAGGPGSPGVIRYEVTPGDSLWRIASMYGTSVERLRSMNGLSGNRIYPGQIIRVNPPSPG